MHKSGLTLKDSTKSNFYEHLQFSEEVTLKVEPNNADWNVRFELKDTIITNASKRVNGLISSRDNFTIKLQAFDQEGHAVGLPYFRKYFYHPISAIKDTLEVDRMPSSWERMRFKDQLEISLDSPCKNCKIEYIIKEDGQKKRSGIYSEPIIIRNTAQVSAKLLDTSGIQKGSAFNETYYLVNEENCLTTGKRTWASNEELRPGMASIATNGRVTLWEHWSDHKGSENWIKVDLGSEKEVSSFAIAFFWDRYRYYQYTIDYSNDNENWFEAVDASHNEKIATMEPYVHTIDTIKARYLRLNILHNSANPGLHVSEFCAF